MFKKNLDAASGGMSLGVGSRTDEVTAHPVVVLAPEFTTL
jgi:hypothetical protein